MSKVADFLVELGTEELPPKALPKLAQSFHDHLVEKLTENELSFTDSEWFATPRRLALRITDLQTKQEDKHQEKLGPAVAAAFNEDGSAKPAALGFARSCGVDISELEKVDTPKGERLAYRALVAGTQTENLLPDLVEQALAKLPIPKAMRWGDNNYDFIRPVHGLVMLLGDSVIDANLFGCQSSNKSFGHRFHHNEAIAITPLTYEQQLKSAKVDVCFQSRKAAIRIQIEDIAQQLQAQAVIDEDLLEEVTALVEWPVALTGRFDESFLEVPAEALIATMASDQKYFHLVDENHRLLPRFITISNIESSHPESVVAGNERVIRPRLSDAKFFYDSDCRKPLSSYVDKLKSILFQNKLGTLFDKSARVSAIASWIAEKIQSDSSLAQRAALLCKCDLMTNMVYEFPELQGIMGRYYAQKDGEPEPVYLAMDEVYMPRFAGDRLPESTTGIALALADRIDTLVGIFGIGLIPSGAKDPFALRRAALGILRIIVEKELVIDLSALIQVAIDQFTEIELSPETKSQVLSFFKARCQAWYQEQSINAQIFNSVAALDITQPLDFHHRINAVKKFNQLDDSEALSSANKRVSNIITKSELDLSGQKVDEQLLTESEEQSLYQAISEISSLVTDMAENAQYEEALKTLAGLRQAVDSFFDHVMVNVDDLNIRNNRLVLLNQLRQLFINIADISLLQK